MRLLLDTHIFLWAVQGNASLKPRVRRMMEAAEQIYVSAASIWEIAVKARLGKIEASAADLVDAIEASGFLELPVRARHAVRVADLPLHHTDPFDRLLVSQAMVEPLRLLTVDTMLCQYSDLVTLV
ncbi:MAG TPA: type II toxin-antitoxin system VapC family toxin [Steroidobacteraceae bacterium]|nr:type II toxin-antitoxin system VapC family toxin [Steroidobacteraceae bacterium]